MTSLRQFAKRVLPDQIVIWLRTKRDARVASDRKSRRERLPELGPGPDVMSHLETQLLTSGDEAMLGELEKKLARTTRRSRGRARGELAMARWDFLQGDVESAMDRVRRVDCWDPDLQNEVDLFHIDCLLDSGDPRQAMTMLSRMTGRQTRDPVLLMRVGGARSLLNSVSHHGSGPMAESFNRVYSEVGLGLVRRRSVDGSPTLGNLISEVPVAGEPDFLPLVTVIVIAADDVHMDSADLTSVLGQSWPNLEVIVLAGSDSIRHLDDAEPSMRDGRVKIIESGGDLSSLIKVGLEHASGALLTVHSYGSWMHPQRIEAQVTALLADHRAEASVSHHVNVDAHMRPRPLGLVPRAHLIGVNPRSTMIRTMDRSPGEISAYFDRAFESFNPVTDQFDMPNVVVVHEGAPLTLSLAGVRSSRDVAVGVSN